MVARVLTMLEADKKWVALRPSSQLSCSVGVHLVVLTALTLLSQTMPRLGNHVSDLLIKFEATTAKFHPGPRGAEAAANSTTEKIPVAKIERASTPISVPLENLPKPVPILSRNRTRSMGPLSTKSPVNEAKELGPSSPVSVMQCNVPVLLPQDIEGRENSSLITPTSPIAAQEQAGESSPDTAVISVCGAGAPAPGATTENLPDKSPGGVISDNTGPARPGAWDANVNSTSVIPGPHGDTLFHEFGPYLLTYNFHAGSNGKTLDSFTSLERRANSFFELCEKTADPKEARQYALETIRILNFAVPLLYRDTGPGNTDMTTALTRLGASYAKLDEPDHAAYYFRITADILGHIKPYSRDWAWSKINYAEALSKAKSYTEARAILMSSLPEFKRSFGDDSSLVLRVYQDLADLSTLTDRPEEAAEFNKKAKELAGAILVR